MVRTSIKKMRIKYVVPVAILALSFFIMFVFYKESVMAAESNEVTMLEGDFWVDENLKGNMTAGVIKIWATSKAAADSTKVRYQTIGFGVSLSSQVRNHTVMGRSGYETPSNIGYFYLKDAEKKDISTMDGWTTTLFTFSKDYVNHTLAGRLNNISNTTEIYLNAVFKSYTKISDTVIDVRKDKITSWEEIMRAEPWGSDSLDGFWKYYNIPLKYAPGKQPVKLYYEYKSIDATTVVQQGDAVGYNINYDYKFDGLVDYITPYLDKTYVLKGYHCVNNLPKVPLPDGAIWTAPIGDELTVMSDLNKKWFDIPLGGTNIFIEYEEAPDAYSNTLFYKKDSQLEKRVSGLAKLKAGEVLSWSTEVEANPTTLFYGTGVQTLIGYDVRSKETNKILISVRKSVTNGITDYKIIYGTFKVVIGGVDVILLYGNAPPPPPTPTPKPGATPTPLPDIPPLVIPEGGYEYKMLDTMETKGKIRADLRGGELFLANMAIPSTESLYTQVRGSEYNIGYRFFKKVVTVTYPIKVSKIFHLQWTDAKDKTKIIKKDVEVVQTVSVERACAYWEIENFDYFTLNKATIYNGALPGGTSIMNPNYSHYSPPSLSLSHSESEDYHIIPPKEKTDGIILDPVTLPTGDGVMPTIEKQDFTYEANSKTEQIKVRNDYLSFNGRVVMDNSIYVKESPPLTNLDVLNVPPQLCNQNVLYKPDQVIPALTLNDNYMSSGTLTYRNNPLAVASSAGTYDIPIRGLENVIVHTPVICDASIKTTITATGITSNDTYVQALKVDEECIQLVIDPDDNLSDFTVDINNYGKHQSLAGYFTRDFAWGVRDSSVSYIALKNSVYRNEVKFPFDVFYRKASGEDEFIAKNTWMRFGHNTPTFYLPMWVNEGIYSVEFRTIAVNVVNTDNQLTKTQTYANTDRTNYVAVDTVRVQVSGRIYGLTIYDVTDYPTWETIFRKGTGSSVLKINDGYPSGVAREKYNEGYSYDYTVGLSNQYGIQTGRLKRFTLPLVNGSHPKITNVGVLKTGYSVKFKVTTTGNAYGSGDSVLIKPKFYYVDMEGKNRREVDIYYTESFNNKSNKLVKMGSYLDLSNIKNYTCGNLMLGIPIDQLKIMAAIKNKLYGKYVFEKTDLFTYTSIRMRSPLMTYTNTNYALNLKSGTQYSAIRAAGVTDIDIVRRMQTYYGEYYIPADVKAVEKGFDVYGYSSKYGVGNHEAFWLKGGYIIINFDVVTEDEDGNKNLSYINSVNAGNGYCSMWSMENPVPNKVSYNGKKEKSTVFNFLPGDFMVYYTDKSLKEDYETYIIN